MALNFLDFDVSEDDDGLCSWSALAAPAPVHREALLAEVQALLHALTQSLGPAGPLDEGHAWDMALDIQQGSDRTTVSLHLAGRQALAEQLTHWMGA